MDMHVHIHIHVRTYTVQYVHVHVHSLLHPQFNQHCFCIEFVYCMSQVSVEWCIVYSVFDGVTVTVYTECLYSCVTCEWVGRLINYHHTGYVHVFSLHMCFLYTCTCTCVCGTLNYCTCIVFLLLKFFFLLLHVHVLRFGSCVCIKKHMYITVYFFLIIATLTLYQCL